MTRSLVVLSLMFGAASLLPSTAAADEASGAIVVDDDNVQCPNAEISTIQKAVDKAAKKNSDRVTQNDVDVVRVCPGLYAEQVSVREPLTIRGDAETVQALDCFAPTLTPDPNMQAIVAAAPDTPTRIFNLQADNIDLQGFVVRGQSGPATSAAVITDSAHSGYQVHDNLIMGNTVAAFFRSSGVLPSSFAYNCLRDNGWGLANHWLPLVDASVHHNSTFRIANFAYEQTSNCPERAAGLEVTCPDSSIAMKDVIFEHNRSMADSITYRFASSSSTTASENTVISARIGMRLVASNEDLRIIDNDLAVREVGLARQSNPPVPPNFGVLIQLNTITGVLGSSAGIGMGANGLKNSQILDNTIDGLQGEGIVLVAGNTGNLVQHNIVTDNGSNGIRAAAGAIGNTFETNTILGNGKLATLTNPLVDARDDNPLGSNVWTGNDCVTDIPDGLCPAQ